MKKILLTLGAIASISAPVTAVVACGAQHTKTKPLPSIKAKLILETPEAQGEQASKVFEQWSKDMKLEDIKAKALEAQVANTASENENPFKDIKDDGLYLWKDHYTGKLWDGGTASAGKVSDNDIERIGEAQGWALNPSVEMGNEVGSKNEDSIYMVYDDDDSDGISMDNFTDTLYFEDTSVTMEDSIYKANAEIFGNVTEKKMFGKAEFVAFQEDKGKQYEGTINSYIGSQNNHVSSGHGYSTASDFDSKMKEFIAEYNDKQPQVVDTLLKYYGQKLDVNGNLVDDPTIINHASRGFAPVYYTHPIFTYKKVFHNVIQITFHEVDGFQCTAAAFELKQKDGDYKKYGSFSLGQKDWHSYWGHNEAKYVGYHPKTN